MSDLPYTIARDGDPLAKELFNPMNIMKGLRIVATKYGAGELAYTPEMYHEFAQLLQRRFEMDNGPPRFEMPNYAVYEDADLAKYLGHADPSTLSHGQLNGSGVESTSSEANRIIEDAARETGENIPGLKLLMDRYARQAWARYGVAEEKPYQHVDVDVSMYENKEHEWCAADNPIATADRGNHSMLYSDVLLANTDDLPIHSAWMDDPGN